MSNNDATILAAITAAGPNDGDGYTQRVLDNARQIAVYMTDGSVVDKAIEQIKVSKRFRGEVVSITKEKSSTRGYIVLNTGTDREVKGLPAGHEACRTERTDNPDGKAMAKRVQETLVGHNVLVYIEVEVMANDNKVRVLRHIEDLGEGEELAKTNAAKKKAADEAAQG